MRISDWSSDVCSSDLQSKTLQPCSGSACSSAHGGSELSAASSPACACTIGYCGSAVSIDGWTLSASARPCACAQRSEEHTSELQSLMRNSYAVFCLKKKISKDAPH